MAVQGITSIFICVSVVVQTLAHNSTATLSVIKDYLINKLQRESQQIEDDERKIRQYREETAHLRSEIQELKTRLVPGRMWFSTNVFPWTASMRT